MSRIVAIGEHKRVHGFAFAGVQLLAAEDRQAAQTAWRELPSDVALVILTPAAYAALHPALGAPGQPLYAVMPE